MLHNYDSGRHAPATAHRTHLEMLNLPHLQYGYTNCLVIMEIMGKKYRRVFEGPAADQTWVLVAVVKVTIAHCQDLLTESTEHKQRGVSGTHLTYTVQEPSVQLFKQRLVEQEKSKC